MDLENDLDLFNKQIFTNEDVANFIKELEERIEIMENEGKVFIVDRIEGQVAVCENRETKEMVEINLENLPENIHDGTVLLCTNGEYVVDREDEKEIEERIKNKMDDLWN